MASSAGKRKRAPAILEWGISDERALERFANVESETDSSEDEVEEEIVIPTPDSDAEETTERQIRNPRGPRQLRTSSETARFDWTTHTTALTIPRFTAISGMR